MPREPVPLPKGSGFPSLKLLSANVIAAVVSTLLGSAAGIIALVAMSFAIYAGFKDLTSPAVASALTALVFAILGGVIAVVVPRAIKSKARSQEAELDAARARQTARTVRTVAEIAFAVIGATAEAAVQRRLTHPRSKHSSKLQMRR